MIEFYTKKGTKVKIDFFAILAWIVLVIAVVTQNVWLAVLPVVYLLHKDER